MRKATTSHTHNGETDEGSGGGPRRGGWFWWCGGDCSKLQICRARLCSIRSECALRVAGTRRGGLCQRGREGLVRCCCCHCRRRRRLRCRCLTADVYAQLFAIVPLSALGVGPEVSNNMSKCASPSPTARWKSSIRRACEARLAKALSGPPAARDVCVSCGRARVRRDGKAC